MSEHFELFDIYKALISITAGLILGFEREMKDKAAGLKTITVICLGACLFTILSYKMAGDDGDPTRIATYIVSGIGFLGAGVIFKEGFNVYGLTTAGIIWIAAAIGMSIGFGEVYTAGVFLACALLVINTFGYITKYFMPQHQNKVLKIELAEVNFSKKKTIVEDLKKLAANVEELGTIKEGGSLLLTLELHVSAKDVDQLENYLFTSKDIVSFSY